MIDEGVPIAEVIERQRSPLANAIGILRFLAVAAVPGFIWTWFWSGGFSDWENPIIYIGLIVGALWIASEIDA